jgi:chemotaxis protein methyltransferase CheR
MTDPVQAPTLLGRLIDQVAIQETYFMREPRELEAIDWHQLLSAAHARGAGEVTVWVCACASGEEAYSVAMLALEAFGHGRAPVSILATDISAQALQRAEEAFYSERSTQAVSAERRQRFLIQDGRKSAVGEQLRSMIRFRRHNLVADPAPPSGEVPFDLILCRNVLIYFGARNVEVVVKALESALRPGGQLILGASDRLTSSAGRFADVAAGRDGASGLPTSGGSKQRPERLPAALRKPIGRAERVDEPPAAPPAPGEGSVSDALAAASAGDYDEAIEITGRVLAANPLEADAYFVRGLAELAAHDPASATGSLRRALYIDPTFALAAFQLGRAQDLRGDARAALRAYRQALRTLDPGDDRHRDLLEQVDVGDIAAACRARLVEGRG